jgi:ABC-type oligopeptide transport system substrate-binding subunit
MKTLLISLAAVLAATALAIPVSAAERQTPGVTDGASASQSQRYVPFVTDFPRVAPEAAPSGIEADGSVGFGGLDAALGVAIGLALGALAAVSLPALSRRRSVSSV